MAKRRERFQKWCAKDSKDDRKINYTCRIGDEIHQFTSEDSKSHLVLDWLRHEAMIDSVELVDNEWYVTLSDKR